MCCADVLCCAAAGLGFSSVITFEDFHVVCTRALRWWDTAGECLQVRCSVLLYCSVRCY